MERKSVLTPIQRALCADALRIMCSDCLYDSLPISIPSGTRVPAWAYLTVTVSPQSFPLAVSLSCGEYLDLCVLDLRRDQTRSTTSLRKQIPVSLFIVRLT